MDIEVYCDGGARGNPGPAAVGIAIKGKRQKVKGKSIKEISKYIGVATNNQAEYRAVIEALEWLRKNLKKLPNQPEQINILLDSRLVVNQLNGKFKIKNNTLRELVFKAHSLENQLEPSIIYNYIPREENQEADRLVNEALDNIDS